MSHSCLDNITNPLWHDNGCLLWGRGAVIWNILVAVIYSNIFKKTSQDKNKTQWVGGSWWWELALSQISAHSGEIWLRSNEGISRISSRSPITTSKMFHITVPWHHSKHPLSCHNGFVMLSRQLCDITMDWWRCHWYQTIMWQTAWIFYTRSRKTWIFYTRSWWWENMDISSQKLNLATYHRIM